MQVFQEIPISIRCALHFYCRIPYLLEHFPLLTQCSQKTVSPAAFDLDKKGERRILKLIRNPCTFGTVSPSSSPEEPYTQKIRIYWWTPAWEKSGCLQSGPGFFLPWPVSGGTLCPITFVAHGTCCYLAGHVKERCSARHSGEESSGSSDSLAFFPLLPPSSMKVRPLSGIIAIKLILDCYFNILYLFKFEH